jgi:S1-C subfamily serine protease
VRRLSPWLLLLLAAGATAGPLSEEASRLSEAGATRVRAKVVRVFGFPSGGLPAAGALLGDGSVAITWSRSAAIGHRVRVSIGGAPGREAEVAARDEATGVTIVRLAGSPVVAGLPVGPEPAVGDPVFTGGYPYGTVRGDGGPAVSLGVLAQALGKSGRALLSTAVNPGEYGGPVADRAGRLVGVMLPDQDPTSGLPHTALLSALRARLPGLPEPETEPAPIWPVHECLRRAALGVWPGVVSLSETGDDESWFSGVVADAEGGVLTARPRLAPGAKLFAVLPGGGERTATVLGVVERYGVTLVRLEGGPPPAPVAFADEPPPVGAFVAAVGNPGGRAADRGPLVTVGVVGGLNRSERRYDALLTDAGVNRGNAGGALVDIEGRVVGILSTLGGSTLTDIGANSGVGFAIPWGPLRGHIESLRRGETISWRPGYLGVILSYDAVPGGGVRIESVAAGLPAEKAGIKAGDVILAVGETRIEGLEDLRKAFMPLREGDPVNVRVLRDGTELSFTATLALRPE